MSQATVRGYYMLLSAKYTQPTPGDTCDPFPRINPVGAELALTIEPTPIQPTDATLHVCREVT